MQLMELPGPPRVYVCELGPFDTIAMEIEEGQSLADYERLAGDVGCSA